MNRKEFIRLIGIVLGSTFIPLILKNDASAISKAWYIYVQSWKCRTTATAEAQLQMAKSAGINTIVYNVHQGGAHYNSAFYARCTSIEPGFDPLGYLSQRGSELGISIYAWICPGVDIVHSYPQYDIAGKYGSALDMHWLDFSMPTARDMVKNIAVDIVSKYPVGICLDYIRYTDEDYPAWKAWEHPELSPQDITTTVSMVQASIGTHRLIADVRASSYAGVLQDWFSWVRLGIVDAVQPMLYVYQSGQITSKVSAWATDISYSRIVPLLSLWDFHVSPAVIKPVSELSTEVNECNVLGLSMNGFAFFDGDGINPSNSAFIYSLSGMPLPSATAILTSTKTQTPSVTFTPVNTSTPTRTPFPTSTKTPRHTPKPTKTPRR